MRAAIILTSKVVAIALVIAILIKYVAVELPIAFSPTNALIGVFLPPVIMVLLLIWRTSQNNVSQNEGNQDDSVN